MLHVPHWEFIPSPINPRRPRKWDEGSAAGQPRPSAAPASPMGFSLLGYPTHPLGASPPCAQQDPGGMIQVGGNGKAKPPTKPGKGQTTSKHSLRALGSGSMSQTFPEGTGIKIHGPHIIRISWIYAPHITLDPCPTHSLRSLGSVGSIPQLWDTSQCPFGWRISISLCFPSPPRGFIL